MTGIYKQVVQVTQSSEMFLDPPQPDARLIQVDWPTTWRGTLGETLVGNATFTWVVDEL